MPDAEPPALPPAPAGFPCRARSKGSTMLLALWALLLISAVVLAWSAFIRRGLDRAMEQNFACEARALAHSGVAVALHPAVTGTSPLLHAQFGNERSFNVKIKSEGGRLNLNFLLAGEDPVRLMVLKEYLRQHGLSFQEREVFMDCLLDWVDADNNRRLNGAEAEENYHPPNRPLLSLDELRLVRGTQPLFDHHPDCLDDFTLMSSGPLDLETVSAATLAFVPGLGDQRAGRFVQIRQGKDGVDGTKDDHVFRDINEALSYLGISPQQAGQLGGILGFKDPIVRITSVGTAGKVDRQVEVVARKVPGSNPQIIQWTEK